MDVISMLGLLAGLIVLIIMAYNGWGMISTSLVAALIVIVTNRMDLWEALSVHFAGFMKDYAGNYFLLFFLGALLGTLMSATGAAKSIACKIVDLIGPSRGLLAVMIITAILSYAGINTFVIVFTIWPISVVLFKEGNIPKRLFIVAMFAGCGTFSMCGLPGTPAIQNIMPTETFGTTAYAAALNGLIVSAIIFVFCVIWLEWNRKMLQKQGIGFEPGPDDDLDALDVSNRADQPPFRLAILPILLEIVYIFVLQQVIKSEWDTNFIIIQALTFACILIVILFHKKVFKNIRQLFDDAADKCLVALMTTAFVTGFGGVVQASHGFEIIQNWAFSLDINPLISACIATGVVACATGSCSSGLAIFLSVLGPQYAALCTQQGIPLEMLHRSIIWAGAGLDSFPHSGSVVTAWTYTGIKPKDSYKYMFVTNIGFTTLGCILTLALYFLFGIV
ncbi:MAG TPA: GntP family permease [Candidatus Mediterraneibacter norfolkensis]|nr:GntP family permease [Candidatus Mediterraneibacter norfolkensis]